MRIVPKIWSTDVPGIGLIISVVAPLDDARGTVMVLVIRSRAAAALTVGHTPLMAHDDVSGAGFTISLVVPLDEARAAVMVQVIRSRAAAALTMGHTSLMAHDTLATTAKNCSHGSRTESYLRPRTRKPSCNPFNCCCDAMRVANNPI